MLSDLLGAGRDRARQMLVGDIYPLGRIVETNGLVSVFAVNNRTEDLRISDFSGEKEQLDQFLSHVEEGSVVWDIGANVGLFSIFTSRAGGEVTAFEPDPGFCNRLRQNISLNGQDVTVRETALSDENGEATLYSNGVSGRSPGLTTEDADARNAFAVDSVRVDDLDLAPPDIVKIDVEGAEASVLRGMANALESADTVFIEVHPEMLPRFGDTVDDVFHPLQDAGFARRRRMDRDEQTHYIFEK